MTYWVEVLRQFVENLRWQDLLDILLVSFILYRLFLLIKGTRAVQLLRGMLMLLVAYLLSRALGLNTITWLVQSAATMILVAIPVVFQPELRRALSLLGQGELFRGELFNGKAADPAKVIDEIILAVRQLSSRKIGALIILERQTGLQEFIETGTPLQAMVSSELLSSIFHTQSPLHDGAVIIRGERIAAAGSLLPLSESFRRTHKRPIGTRHRAALGLTETTDAVAVVVSEETGVISVAHMGQLQRHLTEDDLRAVLSGMVQAPKAGTMNLNFNNLFLFRKS
ncbi:DNA integrity scanning protein DisA [compost metagenome]